MKHGIILSFYIVKTSKCKVAFIGQIYGNYLKVQKFVSVVIIIFYICNM